MLADGGADDDAGADADAALPDPCPAPADPNKAALCLVIEPEPIDFVPVNERFDGYGVLHVAVFDTPLPAASVAPLGEKLAPSQDGGAAAQSLSKLAAEPIRFELEPGIVYPRAYFFDDFKAVDVKTPEPGVWLGGYDLAGKGLEDKAPLRAVALEAGKGRELRMTLTALRRLTVKVSRGLANPRGDGEGPLLVVAQSSTKLDESSKTFGLASAACANLKDAPNVTVEGVVVGPGPYWVTAILDDLGEGGSSPGGALVSLEWDGSSPQIPEQNKLEYAPGAYQITAEVTMRTTLPVFGAVEDKARCD